MEQNTNEAQTSVQKSGKWYDYVWPALIGLLLSKLFGLVGALSSMVIFFAVKPRFGTIAAVLASAVGGVAVAFILAMLIR